MRWLKHNKSNIVKYKQNTTAIRLTCEHHNNKRLSYNTQTLGVAKTGFPKGTYLRENMLHEVQIVKNGQPMEAKHNPKNKVKKKKVI